MPRILALDLSLTHTGYAFLDRTFEAYTDMGPLRLRDAAHGSIKTPSRRTGEKDWLWNRRRYLSFVTSLQHIIGETRPRVILVEVSKKVFARKGDEATSGRYGAGVQYRAGQGLGRAMGWLDGALAYYPEDAFKVISYDLDVAKRAITGNATADKDKVREFLEGVYGWKLKDWDQNEVDALSLGIAYLQIGHSKERDSSRASVEDLIASGVSITDALRRPSRRRSAPPRRRATTGQTR